MNPHLAPAAATVAAVAALMIIAGRALSAQEVQIPRSVAGDKGKYYLVDMKRTGNTVVALHKRIGVDSVGYTRTETDCKSLRMRELGYSEASPAKIVTKPSNWFELVPGSSKSDVANFVCSR